MAVEQTAVLNVETKQADTSVAQLRKTMKGYQSQLLNLDKDSKEYRNTLNEISSINDKLVEVTQLTTVGFGTFNNILTNSVSVAGNLASGFTAVQGAVALVGGESEAFQKTLVKVQGAMALMQGLQGLTGLTKSLKGLRVGLKGAGISFQAFNAIVAANPIFAIISAIALLVAGIGVLIKVIGNNKEQQAKLNAEYERTNKLISENNDRTNLQIRIMKAQGKTEEEVIEKKRENVDANIELTKSNIALLESYKKLGKEQKEQLNQLKENLETLEKERKGIEDDATVLAVQREKERTDREKKEADDRIKLAENEAAKKEDIRKKELEDIRAIQKDISDFYKTDYQKNVDALTDNYENQLALLIKHGKDTVELTARYNAELALIEKENNEAINAEIFRLRSADLENQKNANAQSLIESEKHMGELRVLLADAESALLTASSGGDSEAILLAQEQVLAVQELIAQAQINSQSGQIEMLEQYRASLTEILETEELNAEDRISLEQELQDTINSIELAGVDRRLALVNKEIKAKQAQTKEEKRQAGLRKQIQTSYLNSVSTIAAAATDILGKETAAGKAVAIAGATIDTLRAGVSAFADTPGGPIAKGIALAATLVAGFATVAKIASTDVPGAGNSGAPTPPAPTLPNIQDYYSPEITEETQQLISAQNQQLNKVVLVESDVDEAQNLNKVRVGESTF